jgi:hypothetical protein
VSNLPSAPTQAAPYRHQYTSAVLDITNTTANAAPMLFPKNELDDAEFVNICVGTAASASPTFQLLLVDHSLEDASASSPAEPTIIRAILFTGTLQAGARRTNAAGTAGDFITQEQIIDVRGVASSTDQLRWHLVCSSVAGTTVRILRYAAIRPRP